MRMAVEIGGQHMDRGDVARMGGVFGAGRRCLNERDQPRLRRLEVSCSQAAAFLDRRWRRTRRRLDRGAASRGRTLCIRIAAGASAILPVDIISDIADRVVRRSFKREKRDFAPFRLAPRSSRGESIGNCRRTMCSGRRSTAPREERPASCSWPPTVSIIGWSDIRVSLGFPA
jgi:hypothetical protein